jgi:uncharacterized protein (UPF0332 family)
MPIYRCCAISARRKLPHERSHKKFLARAVDAIEAAEILLANSKADIAAGRAYYAMFYIAEVMLNEKGFQFGKHGNGLAAYGQHFFKTNMLEQKYHRWQIDAFDQWQIGNYRLAPDIQSEVVVEMIWPAQEFLETANKYLAGS